MTIEKVGPTQPIIKIDDQAYTLNLKEYESFVQQCKLFMEVDSEGMAIMTETIADHLIDLAADNMTMEEIRPQLKFLRELGLMFRGLLSPVPNPDQG